MRVLVTGIAGFTGSKLAEWILGHVPGSEVYGIDDLSCGYVESVPRDVSGFWHHSLGTNVWRTLEIINGIQPDYVFHLAAYAAEGLSPFIRSYNYRNNLLATAEVVTACVENSVRRLVFTSSMAVYGRGVPPFDEDHPRQPIDPYGVAKAACEQDIEIAGQQHGLDWCVIRPHNLYGPGQSIWQKYRNVLGIWMARKLNGEPLLIYGDGQQTRAFSFIDDCLPCLWRAATESQCSKQIINLGGTRPVSINEVAGMVAEVMGGATIQYVEPRHEAKQAWCTWSKSEDLLGYQDRTAMLDGLTAMWERACREWHQHRERRTSSDGIELELWKGLYSFWGGASK